MVVSPWLRLSLMLAAAAPAAVAVADDTATFEGLLVSGGAPTAFWFAPPEWSPWDLRIADIGVRTFFPGGDLATALLAEEEPLPLKQRHRLAAGPRAASGRLPQATHVGPIVRLLGATPVKIRVTPRFAGIAEPPAPRPVSRPVR